MSHEASLDDYRWLVSAEAEPWLAIAMEAPAAIPTRLVASFRRQLTHERTSLVLQQAQYRKRARPRFRQAPLLFFTDKGLQQATDDRIASYKAAQLRELQLAGDGADLCCGIGGDLMSMAEHNRVVGFDLDPIAVLLAEANLRQRRGVGGQRNESRRGRRGY